MRRNVWSDIFELANTTTQQLYKVSIPCIDDHHIKEEEMRSVGRFVTSMLPNCSEMFILGTKRKWHPGSSVFTLPSQKWLSKQSWICRSGTRSCHSVECQKDVVSKARQTREGPKRACVLAPMSGGWQHAGGEGRLNVLPWYCRVGVASTSGETQGGEDTRVSGRHVVRRNRQAPPILECAQVTGKAGENGQNPG